MGWAALPKSLSEYRRQILRTIPCYTNADIYSDGDGNSDCDSNSYVNATSNTYTKNSSDAEESTHAPATSVENEFAE